MSSILYKTVETQKTVYMTELFILRFNKIIVIPRNESNNYWYVYIQAKKYGNNLLRSLVKYYLFFGTYGSVIEIRFQSAYYMWFFEQQ